MDAHKHSQRSQLRNGYASKPKVNGFERFEGSAFRTRGTLTPRLAHAGETNLHEATPNSHSEECTQQNVVKTKGSLAVLVAISTKRTKPKP